MTPIVDRGAAGWRSPARARQTLAWAYLGVIGMATLIATTASGRAADAAQLGCLAAAAALWLALRRATQVTAAGRDPELERTIVRLRQRAWMLSYQLLAVTALGVAAVLLLGGVGGLGETTAAGLAWVCLGTALGLPPVVTAVALPDPT